MSRNLHCLCLVGSALRGPSLAGEGQRRLCESWSMGTPEDHGPFTWQEAVCCDAEGERRQEGGKLTEGQGQCGSRPLGTAEPLARVHQGSKREASLILEYSFKKYESNENIPE